MGCILGISDEDAMSLQIVCLRKRRLQNDLKNNLASTYMQVVATCAKME